MADRRWAPVAAQEHGALSAADPALSELFEELTDRCRGAVGVIERDMMPLAALASGGGIVMQWAGRCRSGATARQSQAAGPGSQSQAD